MPCPTCDDTMRRLNTEKPLFWCPRCGTLKWEEHEGIAEIIDTPKLPQRVRSFLRDAWAYGLYQ